MAVNTEIAPDFYRISIFAQWGNFQFNHFLVKDDEPLLFSTGLRGMHAEIREAVSKLINPSELRHTSCYNDDIQGTAGVTLAGLINALKITGGQFKDQRILFLGSGSAAIGLADLIVSALGQQGIAQEAARQQIRLFDTHGLVVAGRPGLAESKRHYAHKIAPSEPFNHLDLATEYPQILAAIENFKPTILIGVSTVGKLFSKEIVEAMSRHNPRPIIFALSNPINKHECLPEDAYAWSKGEVVYTGGVQFPPVHIGNRTFLPSQANNLYIFPAVGMAIYATNAKRVTDEMFIEAAHAVADQVTPEQLKLGILYPPQSNILEVEIQTAEGVAKLIFDQGLARVAPPTDVAAFVRKHVHKPEYLATPIGATKAAKSA